MRKPVVKFTENIIVVCGVVSIVAALLLGYFLEQMIITGLVGAYALVWSLRSLGAEVTITRTFITRRSLFGEQRIAWDEMEWVEITGDSFWFVFQGRDARISMPGPVTSLATLFNEHQDAEDDGMAQLLLEIIEEQGVPVRGNWLAPFRLSRG